MEYKVVSQSVVNNTSTIRFYVFLATLSGSYNVRQQQLWHHPRLDVGHGRRIHGIYP